MADILGNTSLLTHPVGAEAAWHPICGAPLSFGHTALHNTSGRIMQLLKKLYKDRQHIQKLLHCEESSLERVTREKVAVFSFALTDTKTASIFYSVRCVA